MHLFVDLMAILEIPDVPNAPVCVSKAQWLELNEIWPQHCYGDPESVHDRSNYGNVPQTVSAYRIDLTRMFGLTCLKEANLILKDQWLEIAKNPEWRPFCLGGESKGVLSKKAPPKPKYYDTWLWDIEFHAEDHNDAKAVRREVFARIWRTDGRSSESFDACEAYALSQGDVTLQYIGPEDNPIPVIVVEPKEDK